MTRSLDVASSFAASALRFGFGSAVGVLGNRPERPLELWEFEGCPFCRKVREALSVLDLDVVVHPCPKGGTRFRPEVVRRGGRELFPWLVDPNAGLATYESDDILRHLFTRYGDGRIPRVLGLGAVTTATASLAGALRLGRGVFVRPSVAPERPLELWSFEASPYCRLVREVLCELELPYILHNVAKGSPRRQDFVLRAGKMRVPYLFDPNRAVGMFESEDVVRYLEQHYAARHRAATAPK
jgi:glutathione S-transferase